MRSVESLSEIARTDATLPATGRGVSKLMKVVRESEGDYFYHYADYIKMRLTQIAWERRFGAYAAYKRAVLPYRGDIKLAAHLLVDSTSAIQAE